MQIRVIRLDRQLHNMFDGPFSSLWEETLLKWRYQNYHWAEKISVRFLGSLIVRDNRSFLIYFNSMLSRLNFNSGQLRYDLHQFEESSFLNLHTVKTLGTHRKIIRHMLSTATSRRGDKLYLMRFYQGT